MFSIDFPEIIIIFGVALVVLGPKKLPGAAAKVGRWVGRARSMARQFREQLEQEVASAENAIDIRKEVDSAGESSHPTSRDSSAARAAGTTPESAAQATGDGSVPQEAVTHGFAEHAGSQDSTPHEGMPSEPSPYQSALAEHPLPPPEGYGPAPEQLSFDEQLHNTALPPEGLTPSAGQPGRGASMGSDSAPPDVRDWMPETQTWMASAGWDSPESGSGAAAESSAETSPDRAPESGTESSAPAGRAPPEDAAQPARTAPAEHPDR